MILGSHTNMKEPDYLLGAAQEEVHDGGNIFALYSGAPQNMKRPPLSSMKVPEGLDFIKKHDLYSPLLQAPYTVNLGKVGQDEYETYAVTFLHEELERAIAFHSPRVTLRPGSAVDSDEKTAILNIANGLSKALEGIDDAVNVSLINVSGAGNEIGWKFEQIAQIISLVKDPKRVDVSLDLAHAYAAGYDVKHDFNGVIEEFDKIIGIDKLKEIHLTDSKEGLGSRKEYHANVGFGEIGFDVLNKICHLDRFSNIPKILESPGVPSIGEKKKLSPYKDEIAMLKAQKFNPNMLKDIAQRAELK